MNEFVHAQATTVLRRQKANCNVSLVKNRFFDQVRRLKTIPFFSSTKIRALVSVKSNCGVENFDVLEILQLKISCMKIFKS